MLPSRTRQQLGEGIIDTVQKKRMSSLLAVAYWAGDIWMFHLCPAYLHVLLMYSSILEGDLSYTTKFTAHCLSHHLQNKIQPGKMSKRDESPLIWEKEGRDEQEKGVVWTTSLGFGVHSTREGVLLVLI